MAEYLTPKSLRETLCLSQAALIHASTGDVWNHHVNTVQKLINEIDKLRPVGNDGKHDDRHTPWCGCEGNTGPWALKFTSKEP